MPSKQLEIMRSAFHDSIYDRILQNFPGDIPYGIGHLTSPEMPENIGHFLSQALKRRVGLEAASLYGLTSDWFDAESESIQLAFHGFVQTLSTAAHFPVEEWPRAVRQAVENVSDFLIKPVPTLVQFGFGEKDEQATATDLNRRISYFSDYSYLQTAVDAVLDRKGDARASRSEFSSTLSHIDRQMTADFGPQEWVELLDPLCSLVWFARPDVTGLPVQLAHAFFEEKKRSGIAVFLRQNPDAADGVLPFASLSDLLEEALQHEASTDESRREGAHVQAPSHVTSNPQEEDSMPLWKQFTQITPATIPAAPSDDQEEIPLWKQYQKKAAPHNAPVDRESQSSEPAPAVEISTEGVEPTPSSTGAQARDEHIGGEVELDVEPTPPSTEARAPDEHAGSKVELDVEPTPPSTEAHARDEDAEGEAEHAAAPATREVQSRKPETATGAIKGDLEFSVLGRAVDLRSGFIRDLFAGSEDDYSEVIGQLYVASDWLEASRVLADNVFRRFKVDIFSETAVTFTNAVEERFKQVN